VPQLADAEALLLAVGIIGATVMPHAVYLHSGLTQARTPVHNANERRVYPTPLLIPQDPYLRTQMRLWSKMVDEGLHEGISEISFSAMFRERLKSSTPEEREVRFRNIGDPRRRDRFKSTYELGTQSPFLLYAVAAYYKAFKRESGIWPLARV
jgi:hypothetical protein